ncbi:MAG: DegT/DnrJ/EryC1/StrS family aminotransferase [Bacteroidales bacterium]
MTTKEQKFKSQIAIVLGTDPNSIHLYWKGRVALFALLRAAGIKPGDEVILPGFTCVVVPNAILYTGAIPVYVDIQRDSLNPSFSDIKTAVTPKTRVIILQNTFGLSSELETITGWAKSQGILTFEDCTHGFGGLYHGNPNGTFCDAAFFSSQWNKPFSTGIGGFSAIFNPGLASALIEVNKTLVIPTWKEDFVLKLLIMSRRFLLSPLTYYFLRNLYRLLSKLNLTIGSSSGGELTEPIMPDSYFKAMGKTQVNAGIREINTLGEALALRKVNAGLYTNKLAECGKYHVDPALHPNHSFLKYPVLVRDRIIFETNARKEGIELGDWFVSPIHPVEIDFNKWLVDLTAIPVATNISAHVLNLPTDTKHPEKVLLFLDKNLDLLL